MLDYIWNLTDLKNIQKNNIKVFSCFHCGGGSTMGYKLAGCDVLGGVEIDPKIMEMYRKNHNPKHSFLMGVQDFNKIPLDKIPSELFELDILDGSPPCSSFSMAGSRDSKWGVKKKFREGQAEQVLDDLFFHFIETARRLQPKVVISENVTGMLMGKAKGYVKQINQSFIHAGYTTQLFQMNAAFLGVPQARERIFFISIRNDIYKKPIKIIANHQPISVRAAFSRLPKQTGRQLSESSQARDFYYKLKPGESVSKYNNGSGFGQSKLRDNEPSRTVTSAGGYYHFEEPRFLSDAEFFTLQSFPQDYNLLGNKAQYVCGMSVPPLMTANIVTQIIPQVFGVI